MRVPKTVPAYQYLMWPILTYMRKNRNNVVTTQEIEAYLRQVGYPDTPFEKKSGKVVSLLDDRIGWALTHLRKTGVIFSERDKEQTITELGMKVKEAELETLRKEFLKKSRKESDEKQKEKFGQPHPQKNPPKTEKPKGDEMKKTKEVQMNMLAKVEMIIAMLQKNRISRDAAAQELADLGMHD